MAAKSDFEKVLSSRLNRIQINHQPMGLSRAKVTPPVLQTHTIIPARAFKFVPHPPKSRKPISVSLNNTRSDNKNKLTSVPHPRKKKTTLKKFYDVKKQMSIAEEGRVRGDGESFENDEFFEKSSWPSWERMPGDGCVSDIAEDDEEDIEGEDVENEDGIDGDNDYENDNDFAEGNFDNECYECDELDEGKMFFPLWLSLSNIFDLIETLSATQDSKINEPPFTKLYKVPVS